MKQHLGESHADTLWVMSELASDLQDRWKLARATPAAEADRRRALELWQDAVRLCGERLGASHYDTFGRKAKLAEAWDYDGNTARALALREEILPHYYRDEKYGPNSSAAEWVRGALITNCTRALHELSLPAPEAERLRTLILKLRTDSVTSWKARSPATDPNRRAAEEQLAHALHAAGRTTEAAPLFQELGITPPQPLRRVLTTLIPPDAKWRWLHPTDGQDPAASAPGFHQQFFLPEFADKDWKEDAARGEGFGYSESTSFDGVDIGTPAKGQRGTAYFRYQFTTQKACPRLELHCLRDDGLSGHTTPVTRAEEESKGKERKEKRGA